MNKIEELRSEFNKECEELREKYNKKIDKLEKEEQGWKPQHNKTYWYYDKDAEKIVETTWFDWEDDNARLRNKVIFKIQEEAQRYADYQEAKREESYDFSKEEWEDIDIEKYCINYDCEDKKLETNYYKYYRDIGQTYFKTEKQAQEFINKYKDEILEFEFGIKE